MNAVERVKSICKERKIPISKLENDCKFSNGYISQLRKGTFPDDRLRIIANYLDVSVDYLMTGKDSNFTIEMADKDTELLFMQKRLKEYAIRLSKLPQDKQDLIMKMIDNLEE